MRLGWGGRRGAEEFHALVDSPALDADREARAAHLGDMVELVGAMRALPDPVARPEFVAELRARLLAEAPAHLTAHPDLDRLRLPSRPPARRRRDRRMAALLGGAALVGATSTVAMAATSALPGEPLYPIKQVIESGQGRFASGDAEQGRHHLSLAQTRLAEVTALTMSDHPTASLQVPGTLEEFTEQSQTATDHLLAEYAATGNEDSVVAIQDFTASSLNALADLAPQLPSGSGDELAAASETLVGAAVQAGQACPTCQGAVYTGLPEVLQPFVSPQYGGTLGLQPAQPGDQPGGQEEPGSSEGAGGVTIPDVDVDALGPASVTDPDSLPDAPTGGNDDEQVVSIEQITDGILDPDDTSDPDNPWVDVPEQLTTTVGDTVDDTVQGVTDTVDDVLDGLTEPVEDLTDPVTEPLGGLTSSLLP